MKRDPIHAIIWIFIEIFNLSREHIRRAAGMHFFTGLYTQAIIGKLAEMPF